MTLPLKVAILDFYISEYTVFPLINFVVVVVWLLHIENVSTEDQVLAFLLLCAFHLINVTYNTYTQSLNLKSGCWWSSSSPSLSNKVMMRKRERDRKMSKQSLGGYLDSKHEHIPDLNLKASAAVNHHSVCVCACNSVHFISGGGEDSTRIY